RRQNRRATQSLTRHTHDEVPSVPATDSSIIHSTPRPFFYYKDTAPTPIYTLSLHDALPISDCDILEVSTPEMGTTYRLEDDYSRSEEHTSELQSLRHLVCRLLLEKKKQQPQEGPRPLLAMTAARHDTQPLPRHVARVRV